MKPIKEIIDKTMIDVTKKAIDNIRKGNISIPSIDPEDFTTIKNFLKKAFSIYKINTDAENVSISPRKILKMAIMKYHVKKVADLIRTFGKDV